MPNKISVLKGGLEREEILMARLGKVPYERTATNLTNPWGASLTACTLWRTEPHHPILFLHSGISKYISKGIEDNKISKMRQKKDSRWNSLSSGNTLIYAKGSRISTALYYYQCQQVNEILVARSCIPAKIIFITAVVVVAGTTHVLWWLWRRPLPCRRSVVSSHA